MSKPKTSPKELVGYRETDSSLILQTPQGTVELVKTQGIVQIAEQQWTQLAGTAEMLLALMVLNQKIGLSQESHSQLQNYAKEYIDFENAIVTEYGKIWLNFPLIEAEYALYRSRTIELQGQEKKSSDNEPVPSHDIASLLGLIRDFLLRFVVFVDPGQAIAVTLWIAHTWTIDAFRITPYLHVYSPTKRCGKSRLLECLRALVCRPWLVVSATEATILRKIDAESPTILFDEIDTVYKSSRDTSKEGLRAVLNCGFVRGAKVPRCAGREIIEYSVFCPKAFAGIGEGLPDTVRDRSIRIQLIRRGKDQPIEILRHYDLEEYTRVIIERLASWAADDEVIRQLQAARPDVPVELGDRAADIAEPLLAIAAIAGPQWAKAARDSLVVLLRTNDDEEADEPGVRLLGAIRDIFTQERKKQMPTVFILRKLSLREEEEAWTMKWPRACANGNTRGPAAQMARLLRPYGISAGTIRQPDGSTPKGYRLESFTDAFARYLPNSPEKLATTPHDMGEVITKVTGTPEVTEETSHEGV